MFLSFTFVDHTHATAILALANQPDMRKTVKRIYGNRVAYVPYVMPGFDLSIAGDLFYRDNPGCEGLWLQSHGLFTFANNARTSYELMIEFVTMAEEELARAGVTLTGIQTSDGQEDLALRKKLESALKRPPSPFEKKLSLDYRSMVSIRDYAAKETLDELALRGTVTPDHVIRIKPWPMIIDTDADEDTIIKALDAYADRYRSYFARNAAQQTEPKQILDSDPRVIVVRHRGMYALGGTDKAAKIGGDLCEQATRAINAAEAYGRFTPIGEADLLDMEYWSLEQAKLKVAAS